ncbi:MAG: uracil-DNA glycosylase [Deltaproteobacteria bacterium]|nr:uracil-DNA glycosylase [Deltaproteobacteria bacterium]
MTDDTANPQDFARVLNGLTLHLERLADAGVGHLNIAASPELGALLQATLGHPEGRKFLHAHTLRKEDGTRSVVTPAAPSPTTLSPTAPNPAAPGSAPVSDGTAPRRASAPSLPVSAPVSVPARQSLPRQPVQHPGPQGPSSRPAPSVTGSVAARESRSNEFAATPPQDIATLESLAIQYRNCTLCALAQGRTRFVFGEGNPAPKILFVGEGPGQDEDLQGRPFVGKAGKLLSYGILALGLDRSDVYIANMVKCRPPGNRNPEPAEIAACRPILQRQMELLNPGCIVTLGNVPLKALNPQAGGITKERGRWFQYGEWPVLPTFHPAYLLRNRNGLEDWWRDLKTAFDKVYID